MYCLACVVEDGGARAAGDVGAEADAHSFVECAAQREDGVAEVDVEQWVWTWQPVFSARSPRPLRALSVQLGMKRGVTIGWTIAWSLPGIARTCSIKAALSASACSVEGSR